MCKNLFRGVDLHSNNALHCYHRRGDKQGFQRRLPNEPQDAVRTPRDRRTPSWAGTAGTSWA